MAVDALAIRLSVRRTDGNATDLPEQDVSPPGEIYAPDEGGSPMRYSGAAAITVELAAYSGNLTGCIVTNLAAAALQVAWTDPTTTTACSVSLPAATATLKPTLKIPGPAKANDVVLTAASGSVDAIVNVWKV